MKLRDWSWDLQRFEEVEYPDELLKSFLDWIRTTKAWRENPYLVGDRLRKLELDLNAYRAQHPRPSVPLTTTTTEQNVIVPLEATDVGRQAIALTAVDKKARQLANLAAGREALRKKREAAGKGG